MKKMIEEVLVSTLNEKFSGLSLDKLISYIQDKRIEYKDYTDVHIHAIYNYESMDLQIVGSRPETDIEYSERIKIKERINDRVRLNDLRKYEKLKTKLGL